MDLVLDSLANNLDRLHDVRPIQEEALVLALLQRIISKGRLNFRLAKLFQQCGHAHIEEALETADLLNALPGPMDPKASVNSCGKRL